MRKLRKLDQATICTLTILILVLASLSSSPLAAQPKTLRCTDDPAIADIVPVRDQMESDVKYVKSSPKLSAAEVKKAQGLYAAAYGKYDAWIQI